MDPVKGDENEWARARIDSEVAGDVVAVLQQVGREAMPEGMAGYTLREPRSVRCPFHGPLDVALSVAMAASCSRPGIDAEAICWKDILPRPFLCGLPVLPGQGWREEDSGLPGAEILLILVGTL